MALDISSILGSWPFKPGQINVRRIVGEDGREKIQLRLDLGVLQMEIDGRPDGQEPHGHESLLSYYESQLQQHARAHNSDEGFEINESACEKLRAEGVMFYHRYLAAFVLGDYKAVARDTMRNLRLFDFCASYGSTEEDRTILEQTRPYVLMMHTRARAQMAMDRKQPKRALKYVRQGLGDIKEIFRKHGRDDLLDSSRELSILRSLIAEIKEQIPVNPRTKLRKDLRNAIAEERFEDAARIRDELNKIGVVDKPHFS